MNVCKVEHNQFAEWILIPPGLYQSLLWIYWELLFGRLPCFVFFLSQPCCGMVWTQQPSSPWPCLFFFLCYHLVIRSATKSNMLKNFIDFFHGKVNEEEIVVLLYMQLYLHFKVDLQQCPPEPRQILKESPEKTHPYTGVFHQWPNLSMHPIVVVIQWIVKGWLHQFCSILHIQ